MTADRAQVLLNDLVRPLHQRVLDRRITVEVGLRRKHVGRLRIQACLVLHLADLVPILLIRRHLWLDVPELRILAEHQRRLHHR